MLDVRSAFSLVRRGFLCRWLFLSYVLRASASCSSCRIGYAMIDKLAPRQYQGVMMGNWMLVTGLASLFAGDSSGMIPEPTGTTAVATNPGYARLFAELGAGSLAVGIALVVLIPFLRKLITDKAETAPAVGQPPPVPLLLRCEAAAASAFVHSRSDIQSGSRWIAHMICSLPLLMPSK